LIQQRLAAVSWPADGVSAADISGFGVADGRTILFALLALATPASALAEQAPAPPHFPAAISDTAYLPATITIPAGTMISGSAIRSGSSLKMSPVFEAIFPSTATMSSSMLQSSRS